jgi:glycosyltransferase involved in cell wall biosynthesis
MKIVLLHYAAPPVVGGVEEFVGKQAHQLVQAGHQVRILTGRGEIWDAHIPVEILPRIDIRHPHVLKTKSSLDRGEVPAGFKPLVESILGDLRNAVSGVDLVIAHNVASLNKNLALTAALFQLSQSSMGPRLILWHHDLAWTTARYQPELHPGYPWDLLRTSWTGVRQVVTSQARREELSQLMSLPEEQIAVVPGGIDLAEFLNLGSRTLTLAARLKLMDADPILLTPVRITRRKNLELALNVLAALRRLMPGASLVVTGPARVNNSANTIYLKELKALRAKRGLQSSAHLLAEYVPDGLTDAMVADFYRLADVLFLPSREEGFGNPILEAGLGRLPVFCTELSPFRALADGWATYFSPDENPDRIAAMIQARLEDDPVYQMRAHVRKEYTWGAIYNRLLAPLLENA